MHFLFPYAQTAGQQAYQGYMQGLNDKVPELADRAFNRYQSEGNDMYNQLAMSQGMDQTAYGKYRDQVGDWQTNVGRLQGDYTSERGFDIDMYRNAVSDWQNQQSYDFNVSQFDYQKQQDAQARADAQAAAASKRSGRSSGLSDKEKLFAEWYAEEQKRKEEERKNKIVNPKLAPFGTITG